MCGILTAIILHGTAFLSFKYHGSMSLQNMNSRIIMPLSTMAIAAVVLLFATGPTFADQQAHGIFEHYHEHYDGYIYGHYHHYHGYYYGHYHHYHGHYQNNRTSRIASRFRDHPEHARTQDPSGAHISRSSALNRQISLSCQIVSPYFTRVLSLSLLRTEVQSRVMPMKDCSTIVRTNIDKILQQ